MAGSSNAKFAIQLATNLRIQIDDMKVDISHLMDEIQFLKIEIQLLKSKSSIPI